MTCPVDPITIDSPGAGATVSVDGPFTGDLDKVWNSAGGNNPISLENDPKPAILIIDFDSPKAVVSVMLRTRSISRVIVTLIDENNEVAFVNFVSICLK